jgi:DNA-binding NtrC family response regulator
MADIVIVDDEARIGKLLADELADAGHRTAHFTSPRAALERIGGGPPDILVTDLRMDEMDGIALLRQVRQAAPGTDVIVMTAYASLETALETMREGAYDYVIKPFKTEQLLTLVERLEERRRLQAENQGLRAYLSGRTDPGMVGESRAVKRIKQLIQGLAESDAAVLVRGESGTGKELVARAIHAASRRAQGPFIALNCAAIPETLLESELFGYEKGAFTGAARRRMGHFQLAEGGTIFLDEVGDLPLALQAKLLRVIEDRRVIPLGAERGVEVDVRFVSATHRSLEEAIAHGVFREDLFYRLNVFPIVLPPLRERREDIRDLALHFLRGWGRRDADLGAAALERLVAYHWPGNIRELRNVLERALILRPSGTIGRDDILLGDAPSTAPADASGLPPTLNLDEVEKHVIARALDAARGNKSEAARLLGITRRALYGKLARLGMDG